MTTNRRLVALRHTAVGTSPGVCYGQLDVPLALSYHADIKRVRQLLASQTFPRVISSPLTRCHRLATDLQLGPVEKDARLLELSFGQWEGILWQDIPREVSEYWTEDVVNRTPPGGESFQQLINRVKAFLQDPKLWTAGDHLLLVTHAGVIRALHHILESADYDSSLRLPIGFGECRIFSL